MKIYTRPFLAALIFCLGMVACSESYLGVEQVKTESDSPEKVTVNEIISKSGALEIYFSLPKGDPTIDQVVASYVNKKGEKREFKVSRYSPSILVEGFTGTDEATVELACIDASGNKSEVILVKAAPLLSPVEEALGTMKVEPAFGGVKVEWQNLNANPFIIHVLTEDMLEKDVFSLVEDPTKTIYSSDSVNTFAYVRQYPSTEQRFGFTVSDKWGNRTDTLINFLTPYKEEEIDYNLVKEVSFFNPKLFNGRRDYDDWGVNSATGLQNDGNAHSGSYVGKKMFDGQRSGSQTLIYKFVKNLSDPDAANRITVNDVYTTFDLNIEVRLSRVKIFPRTTSSYTYNRSSPKRFRIWGTNDTNSQRWAKFPETWTLIGEYVGREPADGNNLTPEEIEYFNHNQEYSISEDNVNPAARTTETFRYMRLQLMESYNKNESFYTINEIQMFGDIQNYY